MGFFSKPEPKRRGFFSSRSSSDTSNRISFTRARHGQADDVISDYKRGRDNMGNKVNSEDVRRNLARHDMWFDTADNKDIEKALKD